MVYQVRNEEGTYYKAGMRQASNQEKGKKWRKKHHAEAAIRYAFGKRPPRKFIIEEYEQVKTAEYEYGG